MFEILLDFDRFSDRIKYERSDLVVEYRKHRRGAHATSGYDTILAVNETPLSESTTWGAEIGGYRILRELVPDSTAMALAPGNRILVLKTLDPDCLLRTGANPKLHPNIRDRLARVRELAHGRVANLYSVEHDHGRAYLVWEYMAGQTLEEWAATNGVSQRDLLTTARELILTVEALHARGIVHGAIHGRNVIVDAAGRLKLTHVSPLLYNDPRHDLNSVAEMFRALAAKRGEAGSPLQNLASEAEEPDGTLRSMGTRVGLLIDLRKDEASDAVERAADARRRRRSRLAAAMAVLVAIAISFGVKHYVRHLAPTSPVPPEAPPAAMVE
jgi:hypothetical protein